MKEKLQLLFGRKLMVTQPYSTGADITVYGELKNKEGTEGYYVSPAFAPVIIGFNPDAVAEIKIINKEPWITLKVV